MVQDRKEKTEQPVDPFCKLAQEKLDWSLSSFLLNTTKHYFPKTPSRQANSTLLFEKNIWVDHTYSHL